MRLGEKSPVTVGGSAGESSTTLSDLVNVPEVKPHELYNGKAHNQHRILPV
jgi:hypothetical protein